MSLGYLCCLDWWLNSDSLHVLYPSVDFSARPPLTYGPHFPVTPFPFVASLIHFWSSSFQFTRLHSLCIPQGEGEGGKGFFWEISNYLERDKGELTKIFDRRGGGVLIFSPLIKTRKLFFFIKEDRPNCSMLEESLLAHLLYKYTPYRRKSSVFIVKQLQNFNEKFNLSSTRKLPIFLCLAVATEIKTNEWTEIELYKLT